MPSTWPFPKPDVPEIEDRFNFIFRNFTDPCDAPITVWVEAFLPALRDALIAWWYVDLTQIVRTMFTPPTYGWRIRSSRHRIGSAKGRGKDFKSKLGKIFGFDPNAYVGDLMSPFADEEMVMLLPGEVWFWTGVEAIVIFAFEYSVLDITTQFGYEWTSAVQKTEYCHARDDAVLLAGAAGYPLLGIFGWDPVGILDPLKQRNVAVFTGFSVSQDVGPGVVGCSFQYENIGGGIGTPWIETRMVCGNSPRAGVYAERRVGEGIGATGSAGCTYDMNSGEYWHAEIRVNGTWLIKDPRLYCHANGYRST